jgi:hypothetical protein
MSQAQRQPSLSHTANSDESHKTRGRDDRADLSNELRAADELRYLGRNTVSVIERPHMQPP